MLGGEKRRKKGCEVDDEKWVGFWDFGGFGYLAKAGDKNRGFGHLRKRVTDPREISLRVGREGGVCKEGKGTTKSENTRAGSSRSPGRAGRRKKGTEGEAEVRQCGSARQSGNGSK